MSRFRYVAAIWLIGVGVACNAILGNDDITFATSGGPLPDAGANDAPAPGDGGTKPDADAAERDADANVDADDCVTSKFCSDFDPPQDVAPFGWDSLELSLSSFSIDKADFLTSPSSLELKASPGDAQRYLVKNFDGGAPIVWRFGVRIASRAAASATPQILFQLVGGAACGTFTKVKLTTRGTILLTIDDVEQLESAVQSDLTWVLIDVTLLTTRVRLDVNGVRVGSVGPCAGPSSGSYVAALGFSGALGGGSGEWKVQFDRVRASWQ